jgi:hypothetical protein
LVYILDLCWGSERFCDELSRAASDCYFGKPLVESRCDPLEGHLALKYEQGEIMARLVPSIVVIDQKVLDSYRTPQVGIGGCIDPHFAILRSSHTTQVS